MPEAKRCQACRSAVPAASPEGLCPACVLRFGLGGLRPEKMPNPKLATPAPHIFVPPPVQELAGRFPDLEILELLGQGGMGAVYKGRQPKLDRPVAIKVLPPRLARDPEFKKRFQLEAITLARLKHPNIVAVYSASKSAGFYYLVMEYVAGSNLRDLLLKGNLSPERSLKIFLQICSALEYAQASGVVHRDIKPENILLDAQGRVKIADFGLAKLLGAKRPAYALTGSREVIGTPEYMAPEQITNPQNVDHRADIYSMGVLLYEMLTGVLPRGRFAPPSNYMHVDPRVDPVVLRALEPMPEDRFQQVSELKNEIKSILRSSYRRESEADALENCGFFRGRLQPFFNSVCSMFISGLAKRPDRRPRQAPRANPSRGDHTEPNARSSPHDRARQRQVRAGGPPARHSPLVEEFKQKLKRIESLDSPGVSPARHTSARRMDRIRRHPLLIVVASATILLCLLVVCGTLIYEGTKKHLTSATDPDVLAAKAAILSNGQATIVYTAAGSRPRITHDITDVWRGGFKVTKLHFSNIPYGDFDFDHLRDLVQLEVLEFDKVSLDDRALRAVGALVNLEALSFTSVNLEALSFTTRTNDELVAHLKELTKLRRLTLSGDSGFDPRGIAGWGLKHIEGFINLQELDLSSNRLRDEALRHIKGLRSLRKLSIRNNYQITGYGLVYLQGLSDLTDLDIRGIESEDHGAEYLKKLTQLRYVRVRSEHLAAVLKNAFPEALIEN